MQHHTTKLISRACEFFAALQSQYCSRHRLLKAKAYLFSLSLYCECLLFQTSGRAYKRINSIVWSFGHNFRAAIYSATHIYTDFSGLVETTPEKKHGIALRGRLGSDLKPNLREVTLTSSVGSWRWLHVRERQSRVAVRDSREFYSHM
jgi:hypothetical protein